ncbi:hypothetical protein EYZ11_010959 [Aspergillus tanneri]|uniref:Uncharacterized protein n=1 Tax=Aspergillus tanneri TaxID=1220188 RepID=A0A4S3J4D0_9EURO|nr:hypothetical protein EYZ11_010959 [Aspergillus tanneri]
MGPDWGTRCRDIVDRSRNLRPSPGPYEGVVHAVNCPKIIFGFLVRIGVGVARPDQDQDISLVQYDTLNAIIPGSVNEKYGYLNQPPKSASSSYARAF